MRNHVVAAGLVFGLSAFWIPTQAPPEGAFRVKTHATSARSYRAQPSSSAASDAASKRLPSGVSGDWWGRVQENLRKSEYQISLGPASYRPERGEVYQAPNRAHDLRLYFDERGVEVLDRSGEGAPTLLRLELSRWGRVGDWRAASPGRLRAEANRLELEREGLREWYVNAESGLEQGWVVSQRPKGDGALVLEPARLRGQPHGDCRGREDALVSHGAHAPLRPRRRRWTRPACRCRRGSRSKATRYGWWSTTPPRATQ